MNNHFAIAKGKLTTFTTPNVVQALHKTLNIASGTFSTILYYFRPEYALINGLEQNLQNVDKQLEIEMDPATKSSLRKQKEDIELILQGNKDGLALLIRISNAMIKDIKRVLSPEEKQIFLEMIKDGRLKERYNATKNPIQKNNLFNLLTVLKLIEIKQSKTSEQGKNKDLNDLVLEEKKPKANSKTSAGLRYLTIAGAMVYETGNLMGLYESAYGAASTVATDYLPYGLSYAPTALRFALYVGLAFYPEKMEQLFEKTKKIGASLIGGNTAPSGHYQPIPKMPKKKRPLVLPFPEVGVQK